MTKESLAEKTARFFYLSEDYRVKAEWAYFDGNKKEAEKLMKKVRYYDRMYVKCIRVPLIA